MPAYPRLRPLPDTASQRRSAPRMGLESLAARAAALRRRAARLQGRVVVDDETAARLDAASDRAPPGG